MIVIINIIISSIIVGSSSSSSSSIISSINSTGMVVSSKNMSVGFVRHPPERPAAGT